GGRIAKLARAGKARPVTLADSAEYSFMSRIAIDQTSVYFANALDDTPMRIYRVAKTGGDVRRVDGAAGVGEWGVAGSSVYYDTKDGIWQVPKEGSDDPKPVHVRAGALVAVARDRLLYSDGGPLSERV